MLNIYNNRKTQASVAAKLTFYEVKPERSHRRAYADGEIPRESAQPALTHAATDI